MRISLIVLILLIMSNISLAQQNLFNIPSGDMTPERKAFFQQQINFYNYHEIESKSHFVYGINRNLEIGINVINVPLSFREGTRTIRKNDEIINFPLYPAILFTGQANLISKGRYKLNIGTQSGINLTGNSDNIRFLYMSYGLSIFTIGKKGRVILGPYYVNKYLAGKNYLGLMAGYEFPITKRFYLMGDYISGNNVKSTTVLGAMYCISKRIQVCAGYQVPFPNQRSKQALVLELNILGYNYF